MTQNGAISGHQFKMMFATATDWLGKSSEEINALNVFPVPDGDTGTNMTLTMQSSVEEAARVIEINVSSIAEAMARGALLGARGNSGVILSLIWQGLARSIAGKDSIGSRDLADAFKQAEEAAYSGINNPVEGTILTVLKEVARDSRCQVAKGEGNVVAVLQAAVDAAREAVANTPNQLPVLMEAGVVDAGGQGLYTLLEGVLLSLTDKTGELQSGKSEMISSGAYISADQPVIDDGSEIPYGYCTQFLVRGEDLDPDAITAGLRDKGESLVVVGSGSAVRIHIHALDPGEIIHYAVSLGTLHDINIRNMDEQVADMLTAQTGESPAIKSGVAVIGVVLGSGLSELFIKLGAAAVVPGGQTMNPSTRDILQVIDAVPANDIIVLPNNKNVVLAAQKTKSLSEKNVVVIPTVSIPQGIATLVAFEPEADLQTNIGLMTEARVTVKTIEVTRATRSTKLNGFNIHKNQSIGMLDNKLLAVGDEAADVIIDILAKTDLSEAEMVTLYRGADTEDADVERVSAAICQHYPELDVDIIKGGHPHYNYIISVE